MKFKICAALLQLMRPVAGGLHRLWARSPGRRKTWSSRALVEPPRRPVPRLIWSYWHDAALPPVVAACVANWRRHAPGYTIRLLHRDTALAALDGLPLPRAFDAWPAYRQADWLRVALVGRHGGLWLDASVFLTRSPDWLLALATRQRGFAGFHLNAGGGGGSVAWPYLENWCFAAPPGDRFVLAWEAELRQAMRHGETAYLAQLGDARDALLAGIDGPHYLVMHVAARVVLRRDGFMPNGDFSGAARITVYGCRQGTLDVTILGKTGDPVRAFVDGVQMLQANDTSHAAGSGGLVTFKAAATFDDYSAYQP